MSNEEIVGLLTHDMRDGFYILCNPQYSYVKPLMVDYADKELSHDGISLIFVDGNDKELNRIVREKGYLRTDESECVLGIGCNEKLPYVLPNGFHLTDYYSDKNLMKYAEVIHRGFENDGEPEVQLPERRPHFNPNLALFVVAPNGDYAAHCGMWYSPGEEIAYVEPVVTVPEYRTCGLGKAVVYGCINCCAEMGAQSPHLTLVLLFVTPLTYFTTVAVAKKAQRYFVGQQRELGRLNGYVEEMVSGQKVLRLFSREARSIEEFDAINRGYVRETFRAQAMSGVIGPCNNFVNNIGYLLVAVAGGVCAILGIGAVTVGVVFSFLLYMRNFTNPSTTSCR